MGQICYLTLVKGLGWPHSYLEIGHEITFTALLSLPLIQVRQFSATGKSVHLVLVSLSLPSGLTDHARYDLDVRAVQPQLCQSFNTRFEPYVRKWALICNSV